MSQTHRLERQAFGTWPSPIGPAWLAKSQPRLGDVFLDDQARVYWLEGRPWEQGRTVLIGEGPGTDQTPRLLTPAPLNLRSRVHEYGGGACLIDGDFIAFVDDADQGLHRLLPDGRVEPIFVEPRSRFADLCLDRARNRLLAVREQHAPDGVRNELVAVALNGAGVQVLARDHDFYAAPRLDPRGERLCYLRWDHPNMPWDATELVVAGFDAAGHPRDAARIAGGPQESVVQPEWGADGTLYFVSDRTGWWNLYAQTPAGIEALAPRSVDFARAPWQFGMRSYAVMPSGDLICSYVERGLWHLARLARQDGSLTPFSLPYTDYSALRAHRNRIVFIGASPLQPPQVVALDPQQGTAHTVGPAPDAGAEGAAEPLARAWISRPEPVAFTSTGNAEAYGLFYPPQHPSLKGLPDERPPLLVFVHGGPSSATSSGLNLGIQFWTTRGFAVLDVNYRGSTGYGRAYREALYGRWGLVDVDDCEAGAKAMAAAGRVDPARLAIRGGSAGGFTVLCALTFRATFHTGTSRYGVSDLEALARETHKFESRYLDRLIGPLPEAQARYRERSPLYHADRLDRPVLFLQGLEDRAVPPAQTETMVAALRRKGLPVAYLGFANEQHGFRQAHTIERAQAAELAFYGRVLGFSPADSLPPLEIDNMPGGGNSP